MECAASRRTSEQFPDTAETSVSADRNLPAHGPLVHRPAIVWCTGLSGAGKSTLASAVKAQLEVLGCRAAILDGDALRGGLNRDLGFSAADRNESVRRAAETARILAGAGLIVIVALISPYRQARAAARDIAGTIPFLEVFVDTPPRVCEQRDVKGLYSRARAGHIANFTNISDPYEAPEFPDLTIKTAGITVGQSSQPLIEHLLNLCIS